MNNSSTPKNEVDDLRSVQNKKIPRQIVSMNVCKTGNGLDSPLGAVNYEVLFN